MERFYASDGFSCASMGTVGSVESKGRALEDMDDDEEDSFDGDQKLYVQDDEGGYFGPLLNYWIDQREGSQGPASEGMIGEDGAQFSIEFVQRPGHWHWTNGDMIEVITIKEQQFNLKWKLVHQQEGLQKLM